MSASPVPPGAPLELDAIEARANAATPGPWRADKGGSEPYCTFNVQCGTVGNVLNHRAAWPVSDADAAFISHARTDVPALCAEVRRLQARLALVPPKLCGRCEATLHPERRERTLCRRCQTDAIREGVSRAWRNRRRAALAPTGEPGNG